MKNQYIELQEKLFYITIITLPISHFIHSIKVYLGYMTTKLSIFFVILGLLVWAADVIKNKKQIYVPKYFWIWIVLLYGVSITSIAYNLQFLDYTLLNNDKLDTVMRIFPVLNNIDYAVGSKLLYFIRVGKTVIINAFFTFGCALWVYNLFYHDYKKGVVLFRNAMVGIFCVFTLYAILETAYIMNCQWGADALKAINPYLYPIAQNYGWHPPLLWKNQMRLIFPEPSNIGLFLGAVMPLAFMAMLSIKKNCKYIGAFAVAAYSYFVFMSQARTAYVMLLFAVILFTSVLFIKRKRISGNAFIVCLATWLCVVIGFGGYYTVHNIVLSNTLSSKQTIQSTRGGQLTEKPTAKSAKPSNKKVAKKIISKAIDDNLLSVASGNKRSNTARYGVIKSELAMGADHWLLGVGRENTKYYFEKYMPKENLKSGEIRMWIRQLHEKQWKSSYPMLNEYTRRFADDGIGGLVLFVMPFFFAIWKLWKRLLYENSNLWQDYAIVFMGLVICVVSWLGNTANTFYLPYVLLGLGYAMCFGQKKQGL